MSHFVRWLFVLSAVLVACPGTLQAGMPRAFPASRQLEAITDQVVPPDPTDIGPATPTPESIDPPAATATPTVRPASPVLMVGRFPGSYCWNLDCWNCGFPNYYFRADALVLRRDNSSNLPAVLQDSTGNTLLTTRSPDFDFRWGQSFTLGFRPTPFVNWEASYFSVQGWNASASVTDPGQLDLPLPLGAATSDFFGADTMRLNYRSQLHNVEANGFYDAYGPLWLMAGFRYLNLNERFNIQSIDSTTGVSDYNIHITNNLIGAQIGSRLQQSWGRLCLSATGKAGIFGNSIVQRQLMGDLDNTIRLRNIRSGADSFAFVSDFNLLATFRLSEHFALRGGYNVIYINRVALAPDQVDFSTGPTSGTTVNRTGDVFLHGANFGLEARF